MSVAGKSQAVARIMGRIVSDSYGRKTDSIKDDHAKQERCKNLQPRG
jgi:hypothetical protein